MLDFQVRENLNGNRFADFGDLEEYSINCAKSLMSKFPMRGGEKMRVDNSGCCSNIKICNDWNWSSIWFREDVDAGCGCGLDHVSWGTMSVLN